MELATAGVMAAMTAGLGVLATVIPAASALTFVGAVPMGLVAYRHRLRALLGASVAATVVAFALAGTGALAGVWAGVLLGGLVGDVRRRGRGGFTAALYVLLAVPVLGVLVDLLLLLFSQTRQLVLDSVANSVHGAMEMLAGFAPFADLAADVDARTQTMIDYWWLTVPAVVGVSLAFGTWVTWSLLGAVVHRMELAAAPDPLQGPATGQQPGDDTVAPVPVSLERVGFTYPGTERAVLTDVDLTVRPGELVAVVGANGSGKSTLLRLLAGRAPSHGAVLRPGSSGLGAHGGTAMILQRPESQILGVRVADDVVWGLPEGTAVDVDGLLRTVGLAGMGDRDTSTLSGGELQRLAVAAALARRPALLLSDESTAMVDAEGRQQLVALLGELAHTHGIAVVHVTHRAADTVGADHVVHLVQGRVVDAPAAWLSEGARPALTPAPPATGRPLLQLRGVSHTYDVSSPWAQRGLAEVDLTVREGEGVLVVGGNGSGKSTLAWVLAGLVQPTAGQCLLDGRPVHEQVGAVALAFQHARLQVLRPTVGADVAAATGTESHPDWSAVGEALAAVGLDPLLTARPVDQLSGGQLRRVALAGLLANRPRVLVLDEPLAGLDVPSQRGLVELLARLRREAGLTVVVISHDLDGMEAVCSRTVRLHRGRLSDEPRPVLGEARR